MAPDAPEDPLTVEDFRRRPEWHARVLCRGRGPAMLVRGKACPVTQECLETALADPEPMSLWGGPRTQSVGRSAGSGGGVMRFFAEASLTPSATAGAGRLGMRGR